MLRPIDKWITRAMRRCLLAFGTSLFVLSAYALDAPSAQHGLQNDVVFADYSLLSGNSEVMRRMLSPLARAEAQRMLARSGKVLSEQAINLGEEKFVVYIPATAPPHGYGLLVFVPPWQDAKLPQGWSSVLDQYGLIYVSEARSGNDESFVGRRVPLAMIAVQNIIRRYAVDPEHIYISGFSGGSRVALRLALAYADVFRGALLDAGSDPIGGAGIPLPPKELFSQFQDATRVVYLTGEEDLTNVGMASVSVHSLQAWCVFDIDKEVIPGAGHEIANPAALSRALKALLDPVAPDPDKLATCRSGYEQELTAKLQKTKSLIADGKADEATKLLFEIDQRFGGLASPLSVELNSQIDQRSR